MRLRISIRLGLLLCSAALLVTTAPSSEGTSDLSFEARVRAQREIERVYHGFRIGEKREFEAAVPTEVVEERVRRFLRQSHALEKRWKRPVTAQMLDRELMRMVRETRDADRLWMLFAALDNDPVLMRECLARPILVERLAQNFYSHDRELHAGMRLEAERLRASLIAGDLDAATPHSRRFVHELSIRTRHHDDETPLSSDHRPGAMDAEEFAAWRAAAPPVGEIGALVERPEGFSIRIVLEEEPDRALVATHQVPKLALNEWLTGFAAAPVPTVADRRAVIPAREIVEDVAVGWDVLPHSPSPRVEHQVVWTGSEMLVWGDMIAGNTGSRYDPATDTWSAMSTVGAPVPRQWFTAVWTGSEMIVWGGWGADDFHALNNGGRYDPASDSWSSVSLAGAPLARYRHSAVWTGTEMIVWGGDTWGFGYQQTGGRYDPSTDSWTSTRTLGAPPARRQHTAVWTGTRMIVWGGYNHTNTSDCFDDGGLYDPTSDSWRTVSTIDAPGRRRHHSAIWTGTEMIVWGGFDTDASHVYDDGGRFDPQFNAWQPLTAVDAPTARSLHTAVWTGDEMIVWDGLYGDDGGRYDPASDSWSPIDTVGAPVRRSEHTAVWTGTEMIVWGGTGFGGPLDSGGRYSPATDSWTPTATSDLQELELTGQTSLWTGTELIVWGGHAKPVNDGWYYLSSGSIYNPTTGSRTRISAPASFVERTDHTAVWTGSEMLVWGGCCFWDDMIGNVWFNDGRRYDPVADAWNSMASNGPQRRAEHTAVWTGSEMIVWGGFTGEGSGVYRDNGARYFPATNSWAAVEQGQGAPSGRAGHTAVWTGDEMIVWGGYDDDPLDTGGRYDPVTGIWNQTPATGAPTPRGSHTAVWTGEEMIVWGGNTEGAVGTGARYDLTNDLWTPTSLLDAPSRRGEHSAVWTGAGMIVWGGEEDYYNQFSDGSMYVPATDSWVALSQDNAPQPRSSHTAVLADDEMIVWGGAERSPGDEQLDHSEAAFYELDDRDGDGLRSADDCDDLNPLCTTDCTDADNDRYCVTHDCDDLVPTCDTDCVTDIDLDSIYDCADGCIDFDGDDHGSPGGAGNSCAGTDCDENSVNCTTDCTDADGDAYCVTHDCDDTIAVCTDDCSDGDADLVPECVDNCPGIYNPDQIDADGDGLGAAAGCDCDDTNAYCTTDCTDGDFDSYCVTSDCDDADPDTHPGATEINDGLDNHCPGDHGYGAVDEISGPCGFQNPANRDEFSWTPQSGATDYEAVRSTDLHFAADCLAHVTTATYWDDGTPVPLDTCFHYLVRAVSPHPGSWGTSSAGVERVGVCP